MIRVVVIQVCAQTHLIAATTQLMLTQGYLALNTGILYLALNTGMLYLDLNTGMLYLALNTGILYLALNAGIQTLPYSKHR